MNVIRLLLAKDLRRAGRNPMPWLIHLAMPLVITALIGLAFGPRGGEGAGLGRIEFAVVDEDDSPLTQMLRGGLNQGEGSKHLAPVFLDRAAALREITENRLSAMLVIPRNFTHDYLTSSAAVTFELVKNPARSIHPAVLEELMGAVVTALNALSRNLQSEFPEWKAVFDGGGDYRRVADLIVRGGEKLETFRQYLDPPLIGYTKEVREEEPKAAGAGGGGTASGGAFNLFAYLLAGLATMFLLFLASTGMMDLHREVAGRMLDRYHTLRHGLLPFVAAKVIFVGVMLMLCAGILLGGGGLIFGIAWRQPVVLVLLVAAYALFAAGLMAVLAALIPDESRANSLTTIVGMALGLAGGCAFPPQSLPVFLREHISPLLPTYWLAEAIRQLELASTPDWLTPLARLTILGLVLLALAAGLFRRRLARGLRA